MLAHLIPQEMSVVSLADVYNEWKSSCLARVLQKLLLTELIPQTSIFI